jgi:hypothetical protein
MRSRELLFSALVLPVLVLSYLLAQFPRSPPSLVIGHSLAALPEAHPSWTVYPEDIYEGGNYVTLPLGKVLQFITILIYHHFSDSESPFLGQILAIWTRGWC